MIFCNTCVLLLFYKQVKKVSQSVPGKVDQSKMIMGLVPGSSSTAANKSSGKSTADENQSTFQTGVVVALATDGNESAENHLHHAGNQPPEQEMEHSQSKPLYQTALTQSKFMSDETTVASSDREKNVSDVLGHLQTKNGTSLVSEIFKQINQTQCDEPPSYLEVVGSSNKKPKLSSPYITYEV